MAQFGNFNILPIFYDFILGIGFIVQNHQIFNWNNELLEPIDQVKIISSIRLKKILKSPRSGMILVFFFQLEAMANLNGKYYI